MKICLSFKHLFVIFGLGLNLSFYAVASANTAPLCHRLLVAPPTEQQIDQTIDSLARMKLAIDSAKILGPEDVQIISLQEQYVIKKNELQQIVGLSNQQLKEKLSEKVLRLQNKNLEVKKTEEVRRAEVRLNDLLPSYKRIDRIPLNNLGPDGFLSPSGKSLFHLYSTFLFAINLDTKTRIDLRYEMAIPLADRLLINKEERWYSLDVETFVATDLVTSMPSNILAFKATTAQDKLSVITYKNAEGSGSDHFIFQQFDLYGKLMGSGDINLGVEIAKVPYVGDKYWLLGEKTPTGYELYKLDVKNNTHVKLGAPGESITEIPGTNTVVATSHTKSLSIINLETNQVIKHEFQGTPTVLIADSESILISVYFTRENSTIHRIKLSEPNLVSPSLWQGAKLVIQKVPGEKWVSSFEKNYPPKREPGISSANELDKPLFEFNGDYYLEAAHFIYNQWISNDGQRIVNTVANGDKFYIDVWEIK